MTLNEVELYNFKCFESLRLSLRPFSILTGYNAAGKSTAIQPLLLIAQTLRSSTDLTRVVLNGDLVRLGTPGEVISASSGDGKIRIGFRADEQQLSLELGASEILGTGALEVKSVHANYATVFNRETKPDFFRSQKLAKLDEQLSNVVYIGATRIGTPDLMPNPDLNFIHADVGCNGQFAAWWYHQFVDEDIELGRRHPQEEGTTLRRQLDAYLDDLFPGGQANAELIPRTAFSRLTFRSSAQSDWLRPSNIGYGLSYAFPILVALLLARPGQIVVVDSPEAHLHPHGQSQMGRILGRFAAAGIQVIIETHSDHVLNGARLSVRANALHSDSIAIHFFQGKVADHNANGIQSLALDKNGAIDAWPEGFFDQAEHDLMVLSGLSE